MTHISVRLEWEVGLQDCRTTGPRDHKTTDGGGEGEKLKR